MRNRIWTLALWMALGVTAPAWAQRSLSSFGSPSPGQIVFQPIDMSHAIAPPLAPQPKVSFLTRFFPNFSLTSFFTPRMGTSTLPAPGTFPNTPMASPIQPLPPIFSYRQ